MDEHYSTTDAFLMAWFRLSGIRIQAITREGNRTRMHFECSPEEGLATELAYRDSEYERFASLYNSTLDTLKRR